MSARIVHIASNTFREAVRDRVLYNLIVFALLMSGASILVGQISIDIERLVVINLGLTVVSLFGMVIAIFIGIGLVSKEIEKRTLYTVLSRPVRAGNLLSASFSAWRERWWSTRSSWPSGFWFRCSTSPAISRSRMAGCWWRCILSCCSF